MNTHTKALYRIAIEYWPDDGDNEWARERWGYLDLSAPTDDRWEAAWERATWPEKFHYCRWAANLICRVCVVLIQELMEQEHDARLAGTGQIIQPFDVEPGDDDGNTPYLGVRVPEERAREWIGRTKELIGQIATADRQPPPQPRRRPKHTASTLVEKPTATQQERNR